MHITCLHFRTQTSNPFVINSLFKFGREDPSEEVEGAECSALMARGQKLSSWSRAKHHSVHGQEDRYNRSRSEIHLCD